MLLRSNDPAFPQTSCDDAGRHQGGSYTVDPGLTARQWYAGLALQGLLAGPALAGVPGPTQADVCREAVTLADALIAALNGEGG